MRTKGRLWLNVLIVVVILIAAVLSDTTTSTTIEYRKRTRKFNAELAGKERITVECLNNLKALLEKKVDTSGTGRTDIFRIAGEEGITFLEYVDDKLFYWSDNSFDVPVVYDDSLFSKPLVFIHNGWFIPKKSNAGNETIIALLRISNNYSFENDLVESGFVESLGMPRGTRLSFSESDSLYNVTDISGKKLFSLVFPGKREPSLYIVFPIIAWTAFFILVLFMAVKIASILAKSGRPLTGTLAGLFLAGLVYPFILVSGIPGVYKITGLFSGYSFSLSAFIPSMGHLLAFSVVTSVCSWIIFNFLPVRKWAAGDKFARAMITGFLLLITLLGFYYFHSLFRSLILDSNTSFEPYRVLDLSFFSFTGFISMFLLLIAVFLQALLLVKLVPRGSVIWDKVKNKLGPFNITVIFSVIYSLYSLWFILELSEIKNIENKKIMAVSYSSEHDPEAEHLLINLWPGLSADSVLKNMLIKEQLNQQDISNISAYLQDRWFTGYWGNFNLSIVTCGNDSPLWIMAEETLVDNCFQFFSDRLKKYGHQLTGTGFWFLDDQGGRSYYMGQLFYDLPGGKKNGLFIELYSDVDAFQAGYSELLLDKKYQGYVKLKNFSFAKYINGNLALRTGEFPYDKTDAAYIEKTNDYNIFNREGFKHVLYKNGNITVMLSEKRLSPTEVIISFAYLFAFILLLSNLATLSVRRISLRSVIYFNFTQKLQVAFISVLLLSFIAVGIAVAFFSIRQYQARHLENIKEKVNSIYIELGNRLSYESNLSPDWRDERFASLNEFLISLSNVFNTDINLYNTTGYLMGTSRPEVFLRDLTSNRLNNEAYNNLKTLTKSEYIQREKIASLEFVSAYVPFYNDANELLAYLNLPYFRMQSVLAREISNVIVAVVNFTLLLIVLTMVIAVIISRTLTSPLRMLGEGLASVELGKKSEHLRYEGHDEISEIVKQYNRMVDELQESARKLSVSEREYAWREMAKQVAHEIKNPLTPMKLNVQQLYKSWKDGIPGFDRKLEVFTKNQIENIETLSSIASAFSSFAKMPVANPVDLNLADQIHAVLELFRGAENTTFRVKWPQECKIMVHMDKEHLSGIFSNLVKNAIQSVPAGREGVISISVELKGDKVVVSVADNGSGIPDEMKKNLFIPNFTTKSSGMGLGLSIVKRFAETANGRVWFESEKDKGSVFFVELPVIYTVERL